MLYHCINTMIQQERKSDVKWHMDGNAPLYMQLAADIRNAIICGEYGAGKRLQSVRELASDAKVNPNTMQRALNELEREGLVETRGTSGKFVTGSEDALASARELAMRELINDFKARCDALGFSGETAIKMINDIFIGGNEA